MLLLVTIGCYNLLGFKPHRSAHNLPEGENRHCSILHGEVRISILHCAVTLFLSSRRKEPKAARGNRKGRFPRTPLVPHSRGKRLHMGRLRCSGLLSFSAYRRKQSFAKSTYAFDGGFGAAAGVDWGLYFVSPFSEIANQRPFERSAADRSKRFYGKATRLRAKECT